MPDQRAAACSSDRCIRLATVISVVLLAVIAAVVSFGHMRELALRHGEARWASRSLMRQLISRLIAAWPSFAFVGAYHLLQGQLRIDRTGPLAPTVPWWTRV